MAMSAGNMRYFLAIQLLRSLSRRDGGVPRMKTVLH
jgi:hypothetical protein